MPSLTVVTVFEPSAMSATARPLMPGTNGRAEVTPSTASASRRVIFFKLIAFLPHLKHSYI